MSGRALAGACALCLAHTAGAADVAPYFHAWGGSLVEARRTAGMDSAILSFAITRGSCALDRALLDKLPDARNYVAGGGRLLISFGGADGTYAEIACKDDNQLFNMIEKLMQDAGTRQLDFDIEGHQTTNAEGNARRARVLARLQARYPDLYISFTLPGWLRGFNEDQLNVIRSTVAAGVRIDMVNVMTQSFGPDNIRTMVTPSTMGQASIVTFRAAANQMATIFRGRTPAQIHAMMGMTPMIGWNDDGSTFTLADAQTVADFAKLNGVGLLSYWSFQRDQSGLPYHRIFKSADEGGQPIQARVPTPAPAPAPSPAPAAAPVSACNAPEWVMYRQYAAGSVVAYGGKLYIARLANPGYNPTISTHFWSAYLCGGSYPAAAPAPAAPAPGAACNASGWVQGRQYAAGSIVAYGGGTYRAQHANPGYNPTISTYYWARGGC